MKFRELRVGDRFTFPGPGHKIICQKALLPRSYRDASGRMWEVDIKGRDGEVQLVREGEVIEG